MPMYRISALSKKDFINRDSAAGYKLATDFYVFNLSKIVQIAFKVWRLQ